MIHCDLYVYQVFTDISDTPEEDLKTKTLGEAVETPSANDAGWETYWGRADANIPFEKCL